MCAIRQFEILTHANKTLKQGGILIYSTCTYSPKENEEVVKKFLKTYNYELLNIAYPFERGIDMPEVVRLYPHKVKGEGQFVAVLKKLEENNYSCYSGQKLTNSKITNDFIKQFTNLNIECYDYKNTSYFVPNKDLIKKHINYVSIGVRLGQVVNNRFEPNHNLFTAFGNNFKLKMNYNFADEKVKKYLRGETFETDLNDGFGVFFIDECAVGGFKISKGNMKNYYPKGLRNF